MLAIIPARGGSKGIPKKNVKMLCGKPLIAYTIEAAKSSRNVERIILSTDDPQIAEVAGACDVDIPFMRPKELAQDHSLAIDNYIYTIERLSREYGQKYEEFVILLPTSPLRLAEDIDNAIDLFRSKKADSVISCNEMQCPPVWAMKINSEGLLKTYFDKPIENKNRQEIEEAYRPNGSVFVLTYSLLKNKNTYFSDKTYAYVMPRERSVDIDTEFDFKYAEFLMEQRLC